jgi:hypothetical protein
VDKDEEYFHADYGVRVGADTIEIYDGPTVFLETFSRAPRAIGLLFVTGWCYAEVCNGGFRQFFWNSTGVLAPEAAEGFAAIGQPGVANIVREAMASLGSPYPRDRHPRDDAVEAMPRHFFDALNERFYALIDVEAGGFSPACEKYAIANGVPASDPHGRPG